MIKRKVKVKVKKKNPYLDDYASLILEELDPKNKINFKFIGEGSFGEIYYFELNHNNIFENVILRPGKYIIKIFKENKEEDIELPSFSEINYLKKLSNYGLIPKIYIINKNFSIMKYIEGVDLLDYGHETKDNIIKTLSKIKKLVKIWHELGFAHGDLSFTNIIISKNHKVYFIDPYFENRQNFNDDLLWIKRHENVFNIKASQ